MAEVIITYLQMASPAEIKPRPIPDPRFTIREAVARQWRLNRFLYSLVGEDWTWTEKQTWTDDEWQAYVNTNNLRTFVATYEGSIAGYYELHRDAQSRAVEIIYFGLAPEFIGRGFGAALLTDALQCAWSWDAQRVWVHTCTLDHPAAIPNYQSCGMTIYDRQPQPPT